MKNPTAHRLWHNLIAPTIAAIGMGALAFIYAAAHRWSFDLSLITMGITVLTTRALIDALRPTATK